MNSNYSKWSKLGAVCIGTSLFLAACNPTPATNQTKVEQQSNDSIQKNAQSLKAKLAQLQEKLSKDDFASVTQIGKELNNEWLTVENAIREKYPLLYTEAEKYLQPLYLESTNAKPDKVKLQQLAVDLERALTNLENAKETAIQTTQALQQAVEQYKGYVQQQSNLFVTKTKEFTDAVQAKDIEKAKSLYADARVSYERIEPIAESFGELDPKIDAREGDVDPKQWTGYHRLEKALWIDQSLNGMEPIASQLQKDVEELQHNIQTTKLEPTQIVAGSMELLNEAAISKITGEEERYSHTDLWDLAANVEGSQAVYHAILPALTEKNKELASQIDAQFGQIQATLAKHREGNGYKEYTKLSQTDVRELSQQLNILSESMSRIAEIFQ